MQQCFLIVFLLLVSLCSAYTAELRYFMQEQGVKGSSTPYGINDAVGRYVQSGDARIYYEVYGTGRPLFVFHGGGVGSPYELGQCIDELRTFFQVIVVSTRGHGRSEIGHTPLTLEQKAMDMHAVMRAVTDKAAPIVGFSDGAYAALKVAALYPDSVDRLIAIGAGTLEPGFFSPEMRLADLTAIDPAYVKQMQSIMPEPERLQEFLTTFMTFWSSMHVGQELFGAIRCPVLLICGDEDDHAPVVTVLAAHQMLANSRLCVVPKAWHTVFLDNWPVTWACMLPFLRVEQVQSSKKVESNNRIIRP